MGVTDGQPLHPMTVRSNDSAPTPNQAARTPICSRSGTSVPEATTPAPPPMKRAPPARPRREALMLGSTVGAARTISAPPARPEAKREAKNQAKLSGKAQAKKARVASPIEALSTVTTRRRAEIGRPRSAPGGKPAKLAAPGKA